MRYQGGKTRIAKKITEVMNSYLNKEGKVINYYEPFVGANNIVKHLDAKLIRKAILGDANPYVIAYHVQVKKGWTPYDEFDSKNEKELKEAHRLCRLEVRTGKPSGYSKGFIGYILNQCSFGGDFNGGFINREGKPYYNGKHDFFNFRNEQYKDNWFFINLNYLSLLPINIKDAIIYLDPPYEGTSKYEYKIVHTDFWIWVRQLSKHNLVFISEQSAPDDFEIVWERPHTRTLNHFNSAQKKTAFERLYMLKEIK